MVQITRSSNESSFSRPEQLEISPYLSNNLLLACSNVGENAVRTLPMEELVTNTQNQAHAQVGNYRQSSQSINVNRNYSDRHEVAARPLEEQLPPPLDSSHKNLIVRVD